MSRSATPSPTGTLAVGSWDFGGFPYGLEPLVLPPPDDHDALRDRSSGLPAGSWQLVRSAAGGEPPPALDDGRDGSDDAWTRVFWFRWITGHQVTFAVWRLMGQLLDDVALGRLPRAAASRPLRDYVRVCTAMLLYTGSCPSTMYEATVRPTMGRWHPGFSGSWAPDYTIVRDVFRGRAATLAADGDELRAAVHVHSLAHNGIATKLVPDGRSLLSQASVFGLDDRMAALLYDSFFITSRAPVGRSETTAQLLRRLVAIAGDLAANGLQLRSADDQLPAELRRPDVHACADGIAEILVQTARTACGDPSYEGQPRPHDVDRPAEANRP